MIILTKKKIIKTIIHIIIVSILLAIIFFMDMELNENVKITSMNTTTEEYEILVDVEESFLYLFQGGKVIKTYKCSGGKRSTPSPIGTWKIIRKDTWGEGFGGRWMGLNVPWGNFGIHGTLNPDSVGWASSHGCIRMNNDEVAELYGIVPVGTKVVIVNGVYREFGTGFRDLKSGMYGSDVMKIQKKFREMGFFTGIPNRKIWPRN